MKRSLIAGAALVAALAVGVPTAGAGGSTTITLKDISFKPGTKKIHKGQSVTFSWKDPYVNHNVHSTGKLRFKGASSRQTGTYTVKFTKAGTYNYECTLHPGMTGKIVVSK